IAGARTPRTPPAAPQTPRWAGRPVPRGRVRTVRWCADRRPRRRGARTTEAVRPGRRAGGGPPAGHGRSRSRVHLEGPGPAHLVGVVHGGPDLLRAAVVDEVVDLDLDEQRVGADRDGAVGAADAAGGGGVDLPPGHRRHLGLEVQRGAHGHRADEVGLQPAGHGDDAQQPVQGAERLVQGAGEHPAVREAGSALVGGLHDELRGDRHAFTGARLEVQAVGLVAAAAEALGVVRAEEFAGGGRVRVPHGFPGVGRGLKSWGITTHRRRPYPRVGAVPTPCQAGSMQQLSAAPYEERLTAPRTWWLISFLTGVSFALILMPFGTLPSLGGLAAGSAAAAVVVSSYGSARIRVVGGSLVAGEARIPVTALGEAEVLDAEEARAWRTHKADPRCFMLLRAYIPPAVRVEITDPADPTPYVFLSTREPERLAAALRAAKAAA